VSSRSLTPVAERTGSLADSDPDLRSETAAPATYSPYGYEIHEDRYPTYPQLRLWRRSSRSTKMWSQAFAVWTDSPTQQVSIDRVAFGPAPTKTMSFLAMDRRHTRLRSLVGRG